jgi:hypothetical protein
MTRYILPVVAILSVSACQNPGGGGQSPVTAIALMEQSLTAAEKAATIYIELPLCSIKPQRPCSDASVSAKIKAADQAAYDAVKAARTSGDDAKMAAAKAALAALIDVIPAS